MIEIYEGNNVKCSNIYNRYIHVIDPFHIGYIAKPDTKLRKHKFNNLNKGIQPFRLTHRMSQIIPDNYDTTLEFKITDNDLLNKLKDVGNNEFLLDMYIVEWKCKKYFLKRYNAIVYKIEDNIVVIFSKMYDMVDEVTLDREIKLIELLKSTSQYN